jgi:hypothetical protein
MENTLKQLLLKLELERSSIYGFMEIGVSSGREAFIELINMFKSYAELSTEVDSALIKQTAEISEKSYSIKTLIMYRDFYENLLESALKTQIPELYEMAMKDLLEITQAIDLHLSTHTLKGKLNAKKRSKKSIPQDSEEN